ncbi:MAG: pyridoxine 5'-phosphate synthase [Nitrospinae bacterium]|nr:pyridoxine 5'-phosphate synthase [Nitrospinota bacterium]
MADICVNVDHVATVRQARRTIMPDPLEAALLAEKAGAVGITIHLREDRRHIQDADVYRIKRGIATKLNLEMAASPEIIGVALAVKPFQVTLVPERRRELTTEGGLDVKRARAKLAGVIEKFHAKKILVSLFIDPEEDQSRASMDVGADAVEFNTGAYSEAKTKRAIQSEIRRLVKACALTEKMRLVTHAGHGLTVTNVGPVAVIPNVEELNIGHSIVSRSIMIGMEQAVREMIEAARKARG